MARPSAVRDWPVCAEMRFESAAWVESCIDLWPRVALKEARAG